MGADEFPLPCFCTVHLIFSLEPFDDGVEDVVRFQFRQTGVMRRQAVGGVGRSQHMLGEAADLSVPNEQVARDWFQWIVRNTNFDQLLFEHSSRLRNRWLHLSCKWDRKRNRHQAIYNYKVS